MVKRFLVIVATVLVCTTLALAQNTNSSTTRTRTVEEKPSPTPKPATKTQSKTPAKTSTKTPSQTKDPEAGPSTPKPKSTPTPPQPTSSTSVLAAFNSLLDGIRHADVKAATGAYQNTPRLVLFNYNGSVTRGWDQLKQNREASYSEMKDVKLDVRDLRVTMLGRDAALISCLWTQSLTFRGVPETDSGRMTIVFRRIGKDWKAIHLHTSPDRPDPARVPASEQTQPPPPKPEP